jgi:hypothetical protein
MADAVEQHPPRRPQEKLMDNKKPTNLDEVQINDAELDEVVGGKDVLELQQLQSSQVVADSCASWNSCVSYTSN